MSAERNLQTLLQYISPELQDGIFVFTTLPEGKTIPDTINPLLTFREREGTTLVIRREDADSVGLSWQFASRLITLNVHSALDAIGFLAAITARLADAGISVNAVSAFHHDHLFVPVDKAEEALWILREMSRPGSAS